MKKLLLLIIIPFLSFGQTEINNDSLTNMLNSTKYKKLEDQIVKSRLMVLELQQDIEHMQVNLDRHHEQYTLGVGAQLLGILLSGWAMTNSDNTMAIIGGGLSVGGILLTLDSDKWFAKKHMKRKL